MVVPANCVASCRFIFITWFHDHKQSKEIIVNSTLLLNFWKKSRSMVFFGSSDVRGRL